jgi:hypothetical protein
MLYTILDRCSSRSSLNDTAAGLVLYQQEKAESVIHYRFKIASLFIALYCLFVPLPVICLLTYERQAETLYYSKNMCT